MIKMEIIGNLGADAQMQVYNGNKYVSFRIANTDAWTDKSTGEIKKSTQWVSCSMNGDGGNILPYLKKGAKIFVRGNAQIVVYSSPKTHQMEAGVNLFVREIELCGGSKDGEQPQQTTPPKETKNTKAKK